MKDYEILKDKIIYCRIIALIKKDDYLVVRYGKIKTGEFVISEYREKKDYELLSMAMRGNNKMPIRITIVKPRSLVYKIVTWDDIYRGVSSKNHLGEVLRNEDGKAIKYKAITIRHSINKYKPYLDDIFANDFVFVDSPNAIDALKFRNPY